MSEYTVYVTPAALKEIKNLPGRFRQRVRRTVSAFADDPRPAKSKALEVQGLACEVRRFRLEQWRIVYQPVEKGDRTSGDAGKMRGVKGPAPFFNGLLRHHRGRTPRRCARRAKAPALRLR